MVDLPLDKHPVGYKYVFKIKYRPDGTVEKYKARLIAQGFLQQEGIDYKEFFALVVDSTNMSLLLAIANLENWECEQMDVVTAFLHGRLDEEVYVKIPAYMDIRNSALKTLKLKGALYGLKQSSNVWGRTFERFMLKQGFTQSKLDTSIYYEGTRLNRSMLGIHVDDQAIIGPSIDLIRMYKGELAT